MKSHAPVAVYGLDEFPGWVFVRCECREDPIFGVWLSDHWPGSKADGIKACRELIATGN